MKSVYLALFVVLFVSCNSEKVDYKVKNEQEIKDYIATNNLDATRTDSGLYYVIEEQGTGKRATSSSKVTVAYKGYFTDGKVFDQSNDGISFSLNQVIKGWTEGIQLFNEGGSGILLIPSSLGYGSSNHSGIPGGSVLIFEVSLLEAQ
ncbi:FKBP-type peptidyl-prolyl cis-trans isomerase [Formosa sp. PL04]|uniref:FKBP-type peptidyl-prolyl cis-trans isomerase n=1 Tax=Formosa sp. PL04 TaxID=3081755 RepID=UPI002981F99A|nr:FKBP-type peptidyl-prolyl cis-trans isomerase [Formosa sp. PL04]MDW5288529.1 FKBP-type peptidyl-prolyl cis-trans isomerase [Formosa sp. PL04]